MYSESTDPQRIHNRMQELKDRKCEVVLFILNGVGEDVYKTVKYYGNHRLGIVTQSVYILLMVNISHVRLSPSRCTDFAAIAKNINRIDMVRRRWNVSEF
jgi:hypothetical protein